MNRQPNGMINPHISVTKLVRDPVSGNRHHKWVQIPYDSLRELRRDMMRQIKESVDGELHVARSRRGEWGEWFEIWDLHAGKLRLLREGWQ